MDLPCAEWIKHVEQKWTRLESARRERFNLLTDIDDLYYFAQSQLQQEDLKALCEISEKYSVKKSPANAAKFRQQGNTSFKMRDYTSAAQYYTKGVSHAAKHSEELSLCYANRSAALFHLGFFDKCLEDIQRAFDEGYPSQLWCKLLERRTQCMSQLKKQKHLKTLQMKTGKDLSPAVSVHFSPEKGRYLVATENKLAGEVMVEDEAFSLVVKPAIGQSNKVSTFSTEHRHCHHCLSECLSLVPCLGCSYALYCGQRCESEAWRQYHSLECPAGSELLALGLFAHLALRVTLKAGITEIQKARKSCRIPVNDVSAMACVSSDVSSGNKSGFCGEHANSLMIPTVMIPTVISELNIDEPEISDHSCCFHGKSYLGIYSLLPHVTKHSPNFRFLLAFTMAALSQRLEEVAHSREVCLCHKLESLSECWRSEKSLLGATALRHMMQLRCNAQAVIAIKHKEDTSLAVQSSEEVCIATAVFPILSLLNHSCSPNTSISFGLGLSFPGTSSSDSFRAGVTLTIRVCRDIAAGQELFHCYGPHCTRMHVKERQRLLMEQYYFHCQCEACKPELADGTGTLPLTLKGIKCEKCGNSLQPRRNVYACSQLSCDHHISNTELQRKMQTLQQYVHQALECIENHQVDEALRVLLEALTQADSILMKTHPLQGEITDAVARVYAIMGEWRQAASHLKRSVVAVRSQYGEDSVELGRQLFKLTQLHFNGGDGPSARSVIPSARHLLSLHCDPQCEELQELQAMEAYLYTIV